MAYHTTSIDKYWKYLCCQIAVEQDPNELSRLITQLNLALEQRQRELAEKADTDSAA